MTVDELITELLGLPPDAIVFFADKKDVAAVYTCSDTSEVYIWRERPEKGFVIKESAIIQYERECREGQSVVKGVVIK